MEKIQYEETGLLVGLNIDEAKLISSMFAQAEKFEKNFSQENKLYTFAFIRRIYEEARFQKYIPSSIELAMDIEEIVTFLYEKIGFIINLNFLENSDIEAEFYGLCARDYVRSIQTRYKKGFYNEKQN